MNHHAEQKEQLDAALAANAEAVTDLVWTMRWLKRTTDDLNMMHGNGYHPSAVKFLAELNERRKTKVALNGVGREVGL
jgi:hypothetical protein